MAITMMKKKKFQVTINWYGENKSFWTTAFGEKVALQNAIRQLSLLTEVNLTSVRAKVLDGSDSFKVKEI